MWHHYLNLSPTPAKMVHGRSGLPPRTLYNHDIMHCTAEGVSGNEFYSARALGMTLPDDIIQLSPHLKPEWPAITAHYERIGLTHTRDVIWSTTLEHVALHPDIEPSVFFFGENEHSTCRNQRWFEVVDRINSKNNFIALAHELGVPVPETYCFDHAGLVATVNREEIAFPCYLKAAISVSGVGIYRVENHNELLEKAALFDADTPVQIQEEVITNCFLNMQYEATEGRAERLLTTQQILDGNAHQGNIYPDCAEPWETVEPMAQWMVKQGMREVFAFDVAVIEETGKPPRYLAIECNPRYNGASYPTAIALKLDIHEWEVKYFRTRRRSLSSIDLSDLEYNPETGEGVIIVNWGPILVGKLMLMLAGPSQVRRQLESDLVRRLW